jgi:hypothetical protein
MSERRLFQGSQLAHAMSHADVPWVKVLASDLCHSWALASEGCAFDASAAASQLPDGQRPNFFCPFLQAFPQVVDPT